MRTIKEIENIIYKAKENEPSLSELNSTSKSAIWRLWIYIIAYVIYTLELLFEIHTKEVDFKIEHLKPHTYRWYRNKALAYQHGFDLLPDSDKYDNGNATEDIIEKSKVIKYSAITEAEDDSRLIIKIAGESNGTLIRLSNEVETNFKQYINEIKDAGVRVSVVNYEPDKLKLNITIVRDKLVLNNNGMNLLSGKYEVKEAIHSFMKELPFNGELSLQALTDKLQQVKGVLDLNINDAKTCWIDGTKGTYGNYEPIYISKIPDAGYFSVELNDSNSNDFSEISYV